MVSGEKMSDKMEKGQQKEESFSLRFLKVFKLCTLPILKNI
jgi:hypothetical protein